MVTPNDYYVLVKMQPQKNFFNSTVHTYLMAYYLLCCLISCTFEYLLQDDEPVVEDDDEDDEDDDDEDDDNVEGKLANKINWSALDDIPTFILAFSKCLVALVQYFDWNLYTVHKMYVIDMIAFFSPNNQSFVYFFIKNIKKLDLENFGQYSSILISFIQRPCLAWC